MDYQWERYQRQLGLVYQQRIARLRVLFVGDDPALSSALTCFALLGAGTIEQGALCICRRPRDATVTPQDVEAQSLLKAEDVGKEYELWLQHRLVTLNRDVRCTFVSPDAIGATPNVVIVLGDEDVWDGPGERIIYGRTGRVALAMGSANERAIRSVRQIGATNVLTGALASLLGALLTQEALRVCGLLRPVPIERFWLTANIRLSGSANPTIPPVMDVGGFTVASRPAADAVEFDQGQRLGQAFRAVLPFSHDLTRLLWASTVLDEQGDPRQSIPHTTLYYSPFLLWKAPQSADEARLYPDGVHAPAVAARSGPYHLVIGGAGGLGSWLIMALATSPLTARLTVIESDAAVEKHNLNRQILYEDQHIGLPKADAIASAVGLVNAHLEVEVDSRHLTMSDRHRLQPLLEQADMVFTTFDNFAARYVLGLAAAQTKTPVVNGGALVLEGDVELLRANREGCIECLWEAEEGARIAAERRSHQDGPSCSREDHEVAEIGTAIVTTNAIVGSLQALIGLAALGAPGVSPEHIDHKVQVFARDNVLARCRVQLITGQPQCAIHRRLATHQDHVERFLSYEV